MDRLVKNCLSFEFVLRNAGKTNIKTAIKDIAGTICSKFNLIIVLYYTLFLITQKLLLHRL